MVHIAGRSINAVPIGLFARIMFILICHAAADCAHCAGAEQGGKNSPVGEYYLGDGFGFNSDLRIEKNGSFTFSWIPDAGKRVYASGRWKLDDNRLLLTELQSFATKETLRACKLDSAYNLVKWDERLYLIPDKDMAEFCNAVNQGTEPRSVPQGAFYLREAGWDATVRGFPNLPTSYDTLVLRKPIEGVVLRNTADREAVVDLGQKHGVWKGMTLLLQAQEEPYVVVVITVNRETSVVRLSDENPEGRKMLVKGSVVSSRRKRRRGERGHN